MKSPMLRGLQLAGALTALCLVSARAQTVELRATIDAAQEPGSTSTATGWAVMIYDVATNKFDLTVELDDFAATIANSHIHEGPVGVAGGVVTGLGAEAVYTRDGNKLTATFTGLTYGGTPTTLLQNGAYYNVHTAAYPGGEIRGQLIAQPKRLYAILNGENDGTDSKAYGAASITYDPGTNKITTRLNVYNFTNTLANSHYHEAAVGQNGGVVHGLGGASVYTKIGNFYGAVFKDQTYGGDPVKLLTGGAYLNVHSNVSPGGEIRGQVMASDPLNVPRLLALSARGTVGTGENVLINGFAITGNEPIRVLITARGPTIGLQGVTNFLADPMVSLHDSTGAEIIANDDFGSTFSADDLSSTGYAFTQTSEAALLLVLPPGNYTAIVSGANNSTGVALAEIYESRPDNSSGASSLLAQASRSPARNLAKTAQPAVAGRVLELCGAVSLAANAK